MIVGVPDSQLKNWLKDKDYYIVTDEGEAVAMAAGYHLATGKMATVFMSADGFCNALNVLTSLIIPYKIPIKWLISTGRTEPQHIIMTKELGKILFNLNKYDHGADYRQTVTKT